MAGRKLSLKKYLLNEIKRLTNSNDYRLSSFCNNMTFTALPYIYVYCFYYNDLSYFKNYINNNDKFMNTVLPILPDNINDLLEYEDTNLEYYKILQGYNSYLNNVSANSSLKQLYRDKIMEMIKSSNMPIYKLCNMANVSHGNLSMFIKGNLDKLSIDKCRSLYSLLNTN